MKTYCVYVEESSILIHPTGKAFKTIKEAHNHLNFTKEDQLVFHFNHKREIDEIIEWLLNMGATYWHFRLYFNPEVILMALKDPRCKTKKLTIWNYGNVVKWKDIILTPQFKHIETLTIKYAPFIEDIKVLDQHCPDHRITLHWSSHNRDNDITMDKLTKYRPNITRLSTREMNEHVGTHYGIFQGILVGRIGHGFMRTVKKIINERKYEEKVDHKVSRRW